MLTDVTDLLNTMRILYPTDLPRPFALIDAARAVKAGEDAGPLAQALKSTPRHVQTLAHAPDPIAAVLKTDLDAAADPTVMRRPREILGQLVLGELAERAFAEIYRDTMGTDDLVLEDDRAARNDTDYRVRNGQGRPVFRINIKFHGSRFINAQQLVGLDPDDCFALATYKIYQGLEKHETERLPYVFMIVGVRGLTGSAVADTIPTNYLHLLSLIHAARGLSGKRAVEERIVAHLLDSETDATFSTSLATFKSEIRSADWYALSARRANRILREKLFDRVYAVRVRAFARNYRNAELDMHFSLKQDLTPLPDFLLSARQRGLHGLAVELERGDI